MEGKKRNSRRNNGSSSVGVGIVSFLLGFLFAFIVLIGSIFGVGYVAVTTDINEVFKLFGLHNINESYEEGKDPVEDKYNYINADTAPNILALINEVSKMANDGLGELSIDRIDALAPIVDSVLDIAYDYIDEVIDFDKEAFRNVSLVSVLDTITTSVYYVRTSKIVDLLNGKMGYSIDLGDLSITKYLVNGVEAQYASVTGKDDSFKLPVLFDYYVDNGGSMGYSRVPDVNGISGYPHGMDTDYLTETMEKRGEQTLYKVYYVPCRITASGIEEAQYIQNPLTATNEAVSYKDENGVTQYLHYTFRTIEYGADTVFVAVKPQTVDGKTTFTLDPAAIDASCTYYADYARNYHEDVKKRSENDLIYGVKTVNGINYFKDNSGNVIDYDPLTVSDVMLDPTESLNSLLVTDLINDVASDGNMSILNELLAGISVGNIINDEVNYDELINDCAVSVFISDIKYDDNAMTYIVYNITNIVSDGNGNYTAIYDRDGQNIPVTVEVDSNGIIKSVKDSQGNEVKGNTIKDINTITDDLTLDVFMNLKANNAIMAYIGYGVTDLVKVSENLYTGTYGEGASAELVYVHTDSNGKITSVTDEHGNKIKGTGINEINSVLDNVMNVITVPDIIDIDPEEELMAYLGYGVYDVVAQSGTDANGNEYDYVATYKDGADEITVYISKTLTADGNTVINSVWKADGTPIKGTKADGVSALLDNVDQALRVAEFIDINVTESLMAYIGYGVYDVTASTGVAANGKAYTYTAKYDKEGVADPVTVYIATDGDLITEVWDADNQIVESTKIGGISDKVNTVYDRVKLKDLIDTSTSRILQAVEDKTVNQLGGAIEELKVGEIVEIDNSSPAILQAIKDTPINGLSGRINELTIGEIVAVDGSSPKILQTLENTFINDLSSTIDTLKVEDVIAIDPSTSPKILQAIGGYKLNELEANIETIAIGDIFEVDADTSKILVTLIGKGATIQNLDEKIKELTVEDVLTDEQINANSIIREVRDKNIFSLSEEIDKVLIQRIYAENVYGTGATLKNNTEIAYSSEYLYYERTGNATEGYKYEIATVLCAGLMGDEYDNWVGKITEEQFNTGNYYTYGAAKGMWKLVLYRVKSDGTKTEKAYTLNNFNAMVESCSDVVYNSTLGELKEAGIIAQTTNLDKYMKIGSLYITFNAAGEPTTTTDSNLAMKMGDLTLKQLLDVVLTYMTSES